MDIDGQSSLRVEVEGNEEDWADAVLLQVEEAPLFMRLRPFCNTGHKMRCQTSLPAAYSRAGQGRYPSRVACDPCRRGDIQQDLCFYHCPVCEFDACKECAQARVEIVLESKHPVSRRSHAISSH